MSYHEHFLIVILGMHDNISTRYTNTQQEHNNNSVSNFKNCLGYTFLVYGMNLIVSALPNFFTVWRIHFTYFINVPFLHPLQMPENNKFLDVYRVYRNGTLAWNGDVST